MANYSITTDTTYYVNSGSGSDVTGDGSAGAPWRTISGSIAVLKRQLVSPGIMATLQLANGTYAGYTFANVPFITRLLGNSGSVASTYISGGLVAGENSVISTEYVKVNTIHAYYAGIANVGTGSLLAAVGEAQIGGFDDGIVRLIANYSAQGNAINHFYAEGGKILSHSGITLTLIGNPVYTNQFCTAQRAGVIRLHRWGGTRLAFSGTATGTRYYSQGMSVIDTNGGGESYLPGTVNGSTATGGVYT